MTYRTIVMALVCIVVGAVTARAQNSTQLTAGFAFLKSSGSADLAALGDIHVAGLESVTADRNNPALGALFSATNVGFDYQTLSVGGNTDLFSVTSTSASGFSLGLDAFIIRDGAIDVRTAPSSDPLYSSTPQDFAIAAKVAFKVDSLAVGASVKWYNERITIYNADGIGFDLGAVYAFSSEYQAGIALQDVGSIGKLNAAASELPTRITATFAANPSVLTFDQFKTSFVASFQAGLEDAVTHVAIGVGETYNDRFSLRVGYLTGVDTRGISFGAGIRASLFELGYAFAPGKNGFSATNTFGLTARL